MKRYPINCGILLQTNHIKNVIREDELQIKTNIFLMAKQQNNLCFVWCKKCVLFCLNNAVNFIKKKVAGNKET